jgi:hypothetical protein
LREASKTLIYLQEIGVKSYDELAAKATAGYSKGLSQSQGVAY